MRSRVRSSSALAAAVSLALCGCAAVPAGPSVMVLPGVQKSPAQFQADQAGCQQQAQHSVAPAVDAANQQAAATAFVGTALGAAVGALAGYGSYGGYGHYANSSAAWGAGAGLMYGGVVGGGASQAANGGLQQRYDNAFAQCMLLRGNQLPGVAGDPASAATAGYAADAAATAGISAACGAAATAGLSAAGSAAAEHAAAGVTRGQPCSRLLRGTLASRKSIWSARMRRPRRIMSSCRLGT